MPVGQGGTRLYSFEQERGGRESSKPPSTSAGVYLTVKHFLQEITEVCELFYSASFYLFLLLLSTVAFIRKSSNRKIIENLTKFVMLKV
jgi:hypothetical protein